MRKIIVLSMITLDGVMQAPGGPGEDTSGGFEYGGWTAPYGDEESGEILDKQLKQTEYLLGRKTFEIFENYWPHHKSRWPGITKGMKYVLSGTRSDSEWANTQFLTGVEDIKDLKATDGPDLQVHGSGQLIQLLLQNDLVDELWLKTFPLTLGQGKKLFEGGAIPAAFKLTKCTATSSGIIFANYTRAGKVKTGTVGE